MANKTKFTKTEFRRAIEGSGGHVGLISERLNISRSTVYRYLDRYPDLNVLMADERKSGRDEMMELAQTNIMQGMRDTEDKARRDRLSMFTMRHLDKDGVPGALNLDSFLSPDVVAILQQQGIETSAVVKDFEDIIRAQHEKQNA